jgi:CheY-like chemotaxis protein
MPRPVELIVEVTPWVLLVLTDPEERRSAQVLWEGAGFGVEVASSPEEALELLAVMTPSLVVMDDRLYRPVGR